MIANFNDEAVMMYGSDARDLDVSNSAQNISDYMLDHTSISSSIKRINSQNF